MGGSYAPASETGVVTFLIYLVAFVVIVCIFGAAMLTLRYLLKPVLQKRFYCRKVKKSEEDED